MMSGHTFVVCQSRHAPLRDFVHVAEVREENPRPTAIHRARLIICPWRNRFLELWDAPDLNLCARGREK